MLLYNWNYANLKYCVDLISVFDDDHDISIITPVQEAMRDEGANKSSKTHDVLYFCMLLLVQCSMCRTWYS